LSRATFETVTERAETSNVLQAPLVERENMPTDLLSDLMLSVNTQLRDRILERFDDVDPDELEQAMAASHRRLSDRLQADQEQVDAKTYIRTKAMRKQLDGALIAGLLRRREMVKFYAGFSEMAKVDLIAARRAIEQECIDPLALICKAAGFDKALFVTLAVLRNASHNTGLEQATELDELYRNIEPTDAERAIRFWRMRKDLAA
jgi:uncharacterized protein (DUF2336 family)